MARLVIYFQYRDYFRVTCASPPELNGKQLLDLIKDDKFDVFVCNISMVGKCPPKCHCFDQPSQGRTVVNCSHSGKTKLPSALPDHTHLDVDFSHNRIDLLDRRFTYSSVDYFSRIKKLNLQNNSIKELPGYILSKLINVTWLDLRTNEITNIPRALQSIHPCRVAMGRIEMICNCGDIWLQDWLPIPNTPCFDNTIVLCRIKNNVRTIIDMTKESLGCKVNNENDKNMYTLLGALCLVFSLIILCLFSLRFYLFILVVRPILKLVRNENTSGIEYDVYVSCNEADTNLRIWISTVMIPFLEGKKMKVFLPYRDCTIGRSRNDETVEVMSQSVNYVIILSEKYKGPLKMWVQNEWKYAWHNYKRDPNREIIIINYDMLDYKNVAKRHIGTFLRLGKYIDFSNHKQLIKEEIASRLNKWEP